MFYQIIDQQLKRIKFDEIKPDEIKPDELIVGFISLKELGEHYHEMGFDQDTYEQCTMKTATFQNSPLIYSNYCFALLHIINIEDCDQAPSKFAFYLMKQLFLIVDLHSSYDVTKQSFDCMLERATDFQWATLPQLFACFMTNFLIKDNQGLELLELQLEALEKKVMSPDIKTIRQELFHYRRKLLILRNYYEQFINIAEVIGENTNQLFDSKQLVSIHLFHSRVKRLCDHTKDLSEYVSQIKESYMAQLDINLNSIMKVFTIVTTIFMPLTLIVGWYGMNFRSMPELEWKYGYLWVIGLSLTVFLLCIFWFKKKHFF